MIGVMDAIVEVYMRNVDRTLLRENLKLTPTQRLEKLMALQRLAEELQIAEGEMSITALNALWKQRAQQL